MCAHRCGDVEHKEWVKLSLLIYYLIMMCVTHVNVPSRVVNRISAWQHNYNKYKCMCMHVGILISVYM